MNDSPVIKAFKEWVKGLPDPPRPRWNIKKLLARGKFPKYDSGIRGVRKFKS